MEHGALCDMFVATIMSRWPATVAAFLELRMHCVGCPIAALQTLSDAAAEHGLDYETVEAAMLERIEPSEARGVPAPRHRR